MSQEEVCSCHLAFALILWMTSESPEQTCLIATWYHLIEPVTLANHYRAIGMGQPRTAQVAMATAVVQPAKSKSTGRAFS